ncbi:MAG: protein kinase domain-containing protein, partial [Planctomycetales bacterium]
MKEAELPDRIGPYDILRKIGSGGMGTVYLGRHVDTQLEAAVKVLPSSLAREAGSVDRFEREIDAMRKLTGPHIV